jgi:hypothetical protein
MHLHLTCLAKEVPCCAQNGNILRGEERRSGYRWRMIFSEVQKSKGDCNAR